mmetsp:Transcript_22031/g.54436  ORF Transcript_22031/g.54436 Transcript_22031/m.54436 type:complete len:111 (+) Transcript_22031:884-1216(+)
MSRKTTTRFNGSLGFDWNLVKSLIKFESVSPSIILLLVFGTTKCHDIHSAMFGCKADLEIWNARSTNQIGIVAQYIDCHLTTTLIILAATAVAKCHDFVSQGLNEWQQRR